MWYEKKGEWGEVGGVIKEARGMMKEDEWSDEERGGRGVEGG